eukprot:scaffold7805_cov116-Isochrysis_galbana.AAC.15
MPRGTAAPRPVGHVNLGQPSARDVQHSHVLRADQSRMQLSVSRASRMGDASGGAKYYAFGRDGRVRGRARALVPRTQAQLGVPHAPLRHFEARRVEEVGLSH